MSKNIHSTDAAMTSHLLFGGGIRQQEYAPTSSPPTGPYVDTRPRVNYTLPSGEVVKIIVDHGDVPARTITFQLAGGKIVTAVRS